MEAFVADSSDAVHKRQYRLVRPVKLNGIEAARGIAALLVVMLHATTMNASPRMLGEWPVGGLFRFAHAGVDFFFVLSGFIIYFVHAVDIGHPNSIGWYLGKRLARIYPTYWIVFAIYGVILAVSPTKEGLERNFWHVVASGLLVPENNQPILGVAWSLRHEVLFYFLFGFLLLNRRFGGILLGIWATLTFLNAIVITVHGPPYFDGIWGDLVFRSFNLEFFFGIAVAHLILNGERRLGRLISAIGAMMFLCNGLLESFGPTSQAEWPPRQLVYALGSALAVYGLAAADLDGKLRLRRPIIALGAASYSIYLTHVVVIMLVQQAMLMVRPHLVLSRDLWFGIMVISAVSAGIVFARHVEHPITKLLRQSTLSLRRKSHHGP